MEQNFGLVRFRELAEEFAAAHLQAHAQEVRASRQALSRKEINDPLWGTIGLTGAEVALLDSPLLQRLRSIKQLGVVHWVYPGAVHTRFEHSLGVLRQVQYLTTAINTIGVQQSHGELIDGNKVQLLRFAALLHDVGHAAFSHVSEHAIDGLPNVSSIPAEFSRTTRTERRSLSEIFAFYIVTSPTMKGFVEALLEKDSNFIRLSNSHDTNVSMIIEKLSNAIVGKIIDDKLPLLHELISGPFDADKLDYFARDAHCSGTPSLLDISRLLQKVTLRACSPHELPGRIASSVQAQPTHILFGIKWSGISILDELHLSRVLLYAKIYRHPKVVAIEQMLKAAIRIVSPIISPEKLIKLVYYHSDDEILGASKRGLASMLELEDPILSPDAVERLGVAANILERLRLRRLYVKAFQLQRSYPSDPLAGDTTQKGGLIEFRETIEHPQKREAFRSELLAEVERIMSVLGDTSRTRIELDGALAIHPVGQTPGGTQIGRAFLIPSGPPLEFREYLVNRTAWADGYLSDQPSGYVLTEPLLADYVYIAIERKLRETFEVRLPASALDASKRSDSTVQSMKQRLKEVGYYDDAPYDIRPVPDRMRMADVTSTAQKFATYVERYQSPVSDQLKGSAERAVTICRSWLAQMETDDNVECALKLLDNFRMIERHDTVAALKRFIEANQTFQGAVVIPFGSAGDSSAIHTYFSRDLKGSLISDCMSLSEAVKKGDNRPIIFLDDFLGSGGQAKDILAAGFGREELRSDLGEQRDLFENEAQTYIRQNHVAFVYTAGWEVGEEQLKSVLQDLEVEAVVSRYLGEADIPFASECLRGLPSEQIEAFMKRCDEIGQSLLRTGIDGTSTKVDPVKLAQRGLGYGNRAMLLASPFNVPTQTMTMFWASGKVGGAAWMPLLPRRKKT